MVRIPTAGRARAPPTPGTLPATRREPSGSRSHRPSAAGKSGDTRGPARSPTTPDADPAARTGASCDRERPARSRKARVVALRGRTDAAPS